jgi:hypothetical protein
MPHPIITRSRLKRVLEPKRGARILEIGPGTGYYTEALAEWLGSGQLEILDIQREMPSRPRPGSMRRSTDLRRSSVAGLAFLPTRDTARTMAHEHVGGAIQPQAEGPALNRLATSATTHCLTGCAIGEIAGMAIATALGWGNVAPVTRR